MYNDGVGAAPLTRPRRPWPSTSGNSRSGFRHSEVVAFLNEEVLSNGGNPDFYLTFPSRPWNEVEDNLQSFMADPQAPRAINRACAWSSRALGVRVARTRQRELQARRVRRLRGQVEECEGAAWALASELQRLREERDDVVSQLQSARDDLKQALGERDALRERLIQLELSQEVAPESPDEPHRIGAWPVDAGGQREALATGSKGT
uniref:LOW QUALITY PROTEIN: testis-expressed protein 13C-1-like n=1 Tax=Ictidomys tridecemlineatus TaxID=43179 RepID=UPI001A9FDFEF|nr:LOW QUALITY PROTEIN: testis-expressed protein 13C-1-like [Ictidomys tridecemlineatus]